MKFKLWQWEYEFDREDAQVVIPLVLLLLGLALTPLNKTWLWSGGVAYYLLYFFLKPFVVGLKRAFLGFRHWLIFRCPYCKSREVIEQGLQEYKGDIPYYFHICNECHETSVLVNDRLLKTTRRVKA